MLEQPTAHAQAGQRGSLMSARGVKTASESGMPAEKRSTRRRNQRSYSRRQTASSWNGVIAAAPSASSSAPSAESRSISLRAPAR